MRISMIAGLMALCIALSACAAGRNSPVAPPLQAPDYLSLNRYNRFSEVQRDNVQALIEARKTLAADADPQEVFALSLLIRTIVAHSAAARNLADLTLLAGTGEFAGSPYVISRFEEIAGMLEDDLGEIEMRNLVLNKSAYKGVSEIYTGYINDLEQLIDLVRSDIEKLTGK